MKYRLLQKLPFAKVDAEVEYRGNLVWINCELITKYKENLMKAIKDNRKWLEPIEEKWPVIGDVYYELQIHDNGFVVKSVHILSILHEVRAIDKIKLGTAYKTKQAAEYAKIRMEAVTRTDRFVPEGRDLYYCWDFDDGRVYDNSVNNYFNEDYLIGNAFPFTPQGKADCEKWGKECAPAWEELIKTK